MEAREFPRHPGLVLTNLVPLAFPWRACLFGCMGVVWAMLSACTFGGAETQSPDAGSSEDSLVSRSSEVTYRLEWTGHEALTWNEDGTWSLTNDLGFEISVDLAYLVSYSSELVECTASERISTSGWIKWMGNLVAGALLARAHAGHSSLDPNPAAIMAPLAETLTPPSDRDLGSTTIEAEHYCKVHYLTARSDDKAQWLPENVDLYRQTLFVSGRYLSRDSGAPIDFAWRSDLGNGAISLLYPPGRYGDENAAFVYESGTQDITLRIRRDLSSLFHQVDFDQMDEEDASRQVLSNVVDGLEIVVESSEAFPD